MAMKPATVEDYMINQNALRDSAIVVSILFTYLAFAVIFGVKDTIALLVFSALAAIAGAFSRRI